MRKVHRYQVQAVENIAGLEFLVDPPVGRRLYGPGEVVEIDEEKVNISGLLGSGIVRLDKGSSPLARPAECPGCHEQFVNAGGTSATCYRCGAIWPPQEESVEGRT